MDNCDGKVLASSENAGFKAATITHDELVESRIPPPHIIIIFMKFKCTNTGKNTNIIPDMFYSKN